MAEEVGAILPRRPLTRREQQVLALLLTGLHMADIADELGITVRTVKAYLLRIYQIYNGSLGSRLKAPRLAYLLIRPAVPLACESLKLSPKKRQIARWAAQGLSAHEIGEKAGTTTNVVKNYLQMIYDAAGVWTRLEFVVWAAHHPGALEEAKASASALSADADASVAPAAQAPSLSPGPLSSSSSSSSVVK